MNKCAYADVAIKILRSSLLATLAIYIKLQRYNTCCLITSNQRCIPPDSNAAMGWVYHHTFNIKAFLRGEALGKKCFFLEFFEILNERLFGLIFYLLSESLRGIFQETSD